MVFPSPEEFLTLPDMPGAVSLDETECHPVSSDRKMKKQLGKVKLERDSPSILVQCRVHIYKIKKWLKAVQKITTCKIVKLIYMYMYV